MQRRRRAQRAREAVNCTGECAAVPSELGAALGKVSLKNKILHFTLYATDGYMNVESGLWPPTNDNTLMAGWGPDFGGPADAPVNNPYAPTTSITGPVYVWGFTDIDPIIDLRPLPAGNHAPTGQVAPDNVGNAKVPAPFIECMHMDHVFITVINRGMFLFENKPDAMQDDHSLHLHGIHAQTPYDGFPESAGGYTEQLRHFWEEPWYQALGNNPRARDEAWNKKTLTQQLALLNAVPDAQKIVRNNNLNPRGGIPNWLNHMEVPPYGVGDGNMGFIDEPERTQLAQFTYYFTPHHPGTYMYHCHVAASEHVQMGMYGALIVRPMDFKMTDKTTWTSLGKCTNSNFDVEYTIILSEFDARWHLQIESDGELFPDYYLAEWRPDLWMANGRTFPTTLLPFKWNAPVTPDPLPPNIPASYYEESRYNTYLKHSPKQKILIRYINMGYQEHPMHQHGWMMRVVGKDARPKTPLQEVFTLLIGSGETYDTITIANPAYGITTSAGSPLSSPTMPTPGTLNWRILYPIHDHDDYRVTTNGFYPGGAVLILETCPPPTGVPAGTPTWDNVYANAGAGEVQPVPPGCQ